MVLSPLGVLLSHINTIATMTEVLQSVGGFEVPDSLLKVRPSMALEAHQEELLSRKAEV